MGPSEAARAAEQMGLNRNGTEAGGLLSCAFERISGEIPRGPLHDCTMTPWRVTLQAACRLAAAKSKAWLGGKRKS